MPERLTWIGGYRAVGKSADEALRVYRDVLALQEAGAFAVELEVVPHRIAAEITKRVEIFVLSMGSGSGCDGEYLFGCDILGQHDGRIPRHAKKYRDHFSEMQRIEKDAAEAFGEFKADVLSGAFPSRENVVEVDEREFDTFMAEVDKTGA